MVSGEKRHRPEQVFDISMAPVFPFDSGNGRYIARPESRRRRDQQEKANKKKNHVAMVSVESHIARSR
jgi:hypothetical protein